MIVDHICATLSPQKIEAIAERISNDALLALMADRVCDTLSDEKIEAIAERSIAERIGILTLPQAARHLQCRNEKQLTDFLRKQKIPIIHFGAKKRFVKLSEIEAAQSRSRVSIANSKNSTGTVISAVPNQPNIPTKA